MLVNIGCQNNSGTCSLGHLRELSSEPCSYRAFLAGVVPGGGVFHLHPVTPLSVKSDDSNFVQNYFGIGSIFWGKKNRDQIDNDVTMTLSFLC